MRTKLMTVFFIALVVTACGGKKTVKTVPPTPEERIAQLRAENPEAADRLQEEQEAIRRKAAELKGEKDLEEAQKAIRKSETREERDARKALQKDEKKVESNREEALKTAFTVTGCTSPAERRKVFVLPNHVGTGWRPNPFVYVTITNAEKFPINIRLSEITVVQSLCAGGTVTLLEKMSGWAPNYSVKTFHFTATGTYPDGTPGVLDSPQYTLQKYNGSFGGRREIQPATWTVNLKRLR